MIKSAPSACEAPVIMLRRNSAWPGASIRTTSRDLVRKRICVVSMVMPWSRSVCSASSRNDHSNGMPRRALTALSISSLPSGRLPVSCSNRPTSVDLPWSTWPTMTMRTCGRVVPFGVACVVLESIMFIAAPTSNSYLQIAGDAQPLERILGLVIQRAPGTLRHFRAVQLMEDFVDIGCVGQDRIGDVLVAERAVALAVFGEIQRN